MPNLFPPVHHSCRLSSSDRIVQGGPKKRHHWPALFLLSGETNSLKKVLQGGAALFLGRFTPSTPKKKSPFIQIAWIPNNHCFTIYYKGYFTTKPDQPFYSPNLDPNWLPRRRATFLGGCSTRSSWPVKHSCSLRQEEYLGWDMEGCG